jgi:sulfite reductase alpha subunit-like flavoprotein
LKAIEVGIFVVNMPKVALVYGSFFMGDCERDIQTIKEALQKEGLEVTDPVEGDKFNFDTLKDCSHLVVCTSSQYGMPPPNFKDFAHHLLNAATNHPGCLSHLQHAVYGNGDDTYFKTYMNMPRYMDRLLEKAGSKRFFARGETGEPNAPLDLEKCTCVAWAPAVASAAKAGVAEPVAWDALWAKHEPEHHKDVTEWDLKKLENKLKFKPASTPAIFSKL